VQRSCRDAAQQWRVGRVQVWEGRLCGCPSCCMVALFFDPSLRLLPSHRCPLSGCWVWRWAPSYRVCMSPTGCVSTCPTPLPPTPPYPPLPPTPADGSQSWVISFAPLPPVPVAPHSSSDLLQAEGNSAGVCGCRGAVHRGAPRGRDCCGGRGVHLGGRWVRMGWVACVCAHTDTHIHWSWSGDPLVCRMQCAVLVL
jgi:hypothetical protein